MWSQFRVYGSGFGIPKSQNTANQVHTNIAVKINVCTQCVNAVYREGKR